MNFDTLQIIYLLLIFVVVSALALMILLLLNPRPLRSRLEQLNEGAEKKPDSGWVVRFRQITGPLSKLSLPKEGWENTRMRIRFMNAGYHGTTSPLLFFIAKYVLSISLPGALLAYTSIAGIPFKTAWFIGFLILLALIGYIIPSVFLERRIAHRKLVIFEDFPDAIDLLTVCVEAGLGLDAALARVSEEIRLKSQILGDELHLVNLELRAGSTRERALRNLALRTGVEEVDMFVAMLVQSYRFGTSISGALRIESDTLRTRRRQRAEEMAAKVPLKLLFPVIFCIFPTMLLVLLGPAFINIYRTLVPFLKHGGAG